MAAFAAYAESHLKTRPFHPCVIVLVAAVAVGMTGRLARAQAGLRGPEDASAFPTSPTSAPPVSPEGASSPPNDASPTAADETSPPATTQNTESGGAPNYGKPRKRKPKLYKPTLRSNPPLSPLVSYRGAPGLRKVLNPVPPPAGTIDAPQPAPTVAVIQSPPRLKRPIVELDPYAPTGVRVGALRLLPFVEASTGYETNPNQVSAGIKPSAVLRAAGGVSVESDFPTNSLTGSLRGGYSDFPANTNANRPDASGFVDGRIDVTRDDQINLEGRFTVATQTPGSPLLAVANSVFITNRALIASEGATVGATHRFNRLAIDLRGTFDRTQYGNATQSDGTIFPFSQYNYNDIGVVARASYEVTPALSPFAEVGFDSRVHDDPVDPTGFFRNSNGIEARAGSAIEFTRLITGTLSGGYADRRYADARLPNLRGPTVDGSLVYAATPLTTVTFRAATTLSETTLAGASGAISRSLSLEIAHVFFRHFTLSGIAVYQPNEYEGVPVNETFTSFTLKGAYAITRDVQIIASASEQNLASSLPGNSFRDAIFLTGVRLQR